MLRFYCRTSDKEKPPIKVLSLFSGAGGLDIGFSDAGFDIIESVEIEKDFCETIRRNSQISDNSMEQTVSCMDIREYNPQFSTVDFVIGGPPCQTFSAAGRRANGVLGTNDERGMLFKEYIRILERLSPKGFLFENVYGIVGAEKGGPWKEIIEGFSSIGYHLFYRILDSADYGVPQHRERLIIVGLQDGIYLFPKPLFGPDSSEKRPFYSAELALATAPNQEGDVPGQIGGRWAHLIPGIPPGLNYSYYTSEMGNPHAFFSWRSKFSDFMYKADPETPVRTIKARGGLYTGPFHWENRHFSVPEHKRLQTFPDDYIICGSKGAIIQQIGNSVPPQFARIMALSIRSQVFKRNIPFTLEKLDPHDTLGFRSRKRELSRSYQEKAKNALATQAFQQPLAKSYSYTANLSEDFALIPQDSLDGRYSIDVLWGSSLEVDVIQKGLEEAPSTTIKLIVEPTENWVLPVKRIVCEAHGSSLSTYTVMWKAIEETLRGNGLKEDLIQLSSYYQYKPKIRCHLSCRSKGELYAILADIASGPVTRRIMESKELSSRWGIPENELIEVARRLRKLGIEIRNWRTNSQIREGEWLIPYEFPTLTPRSVQLRKRV
jgi:DNA (cytosine-5)-methyltransferase 1